MNNFYLKQKRLHKDAQLMKRATDESAGFDIFAPEAGSIEPMSRKMIPLGFSTEFPRGYVGLFGDRSGMGGKGIHHFGGVVDSDYRGEWKVILYNSNLTTFSWSAGDRIIQVVFQAVEIGCESEWVDQLRQSGRAGGFGSTGA